MPRLIGLTGLPGYIKYAGKDTTADILSEIVQGRGESVARAGFADKVKKSIAETFGIPVEDMDFFKESARIVVTYADPTSSNSYRRIEMDGRDFIIKFATEGHRNVFHQDFWVDALLPTGHSMATQGNIGAPTWYKNFGGNCWDVPPADLCLITDLRFDNEAERIRDLGGEIWVIERKVGKPIQHISEKGITFDGNERRIDNNGSLDDLRDLVEMVWAETAV